MLNEQPIFLNCFGGGGSTTLMSLLISHPDVCLSSGETHKVFKPGTRFDAGWLGIKKRFFYDYPIRLLTGQDIFSRRLLVERKHVPLYLQRYIDQILYQGRFLVRIESHNLYKSEGVEYTYDELAQCRLLTKSLDGTIFCVNMFREMYPGAMFFGLVRNGLALCEGRTRRGGSAERFAYVFNAVVNKMLILSTEMDNYHILRYEDMVLNPLNFMQRVYTLARLDRSKVAKVRMESRPVMGADGTRSLLRGSLKRLYWYTYDELRGYIRTDVDDNQIRQLSPMNRKTFLSLAGGTMERLGYPRE